MVEFAEAQRGPAHALWRFGEWVPIWRKTQLKKTVENPSTNRNTHPPWARQLIGGRWWFKI